MSGNDFLSLIEGEILPAWVYKLHSTLKQNDYNIHTIKNFYLAWKEHIFGQGVSSSKNGKPTAQIILRSDLMVCRYFYGGLKMIQSAAESNHTLLDSLRPAHPTESNYRIALMHRSTTKDNNDNNSISSNKQGSVRYLSLGTVAEDSQHVLSKLNRAYCDDDGRPFADIRISRALVIHDPFDDPEGMDDLLKCREVVTSSDCDNDNGKKKNDAKEDDGYALVPQSPTYDRPPEETVPVRIQADDTTLFATAGWDDNNDEERQYEDEDEEDEATRQKRLELQVELSCWKC